MGGCSRPLCNPRCMACPRSRARSPPARPRAPLPPPSPSRVHAYDHQAAQGDPPAKARAHALTRENRTSRHTQAGNIHSPCPRCRGGLSCRHRRRRRQPGDPGPSCSSQPCTWCTQGPRETAGAPQPYLHPPMSCRQGIGAGHRFHQPCPRSIRPAWGVGLVPAPPRAPVTARQPVTSPTCMSLQDDPV